MPYIVPPKRFVLDGTRLPELGAACTDLGDLTYVLYRIAADFTRYGDGLPSYEDVLAALENTKLEYHRRFLHDYEDQKLEANGDV